MVVVNIGDSRVLESREVAGGMAIRRRRETADGRRFTTYERIEKPRIIVIKSQGERVDVENYLTGLSYLQQCISRSASFSNRKKKLSRS